jgi:hypothetical protein
VRLYSSFFKLLGFTGLKDMLASAYGLKSYAWPVLALQLSGTLLTVLAAFCAQWIWDPPLAIAVLVGLEILNTVYGLKVARTVKKEPLTWAKFERVFGKIVGTLLLLMAVKNAINSYAYYRVLADLIFGWLFSAKLRKLVVKMVALKVAEGGLPKLMRSVIESVLASKFGPYLVDHAQRVPPVAAKPPAVEPVSPLPSEGHDRPAS